MSENAVNNLVCLSFLGGAYHGTQIQSNALTVQEVFQVALERVLGTLPDIKCCSRLDAGVHARKFYVSFFTERSYEDGILAMALNAALPDDVRAISSRRVPEEFHARYSSLGKRYEYLIWNRRYMDPFLQGRAHLYPRPIDAEAMDRTAKRFLGTHDFSSFCSVKTDVEDRTRTVTSCGAAREGNLIRLHFEADGFLYNMARIMAGALLQTAAGKLDEKTIGEYLDGGKPRDNLLITLPACGLYLTEVLYDLG